MKMSVAARYLHGTLALVGRTVPSSYTLPVGSILVSWRWAR